jgi:hypothetical protein
MNLPRILPVLLTVLLFAAGTRAEEWNPQRFADHDVLEMLTVDADDGEHWSKVWLVVVDGQIFVRLGERAAGRVQGSTRWPYVDVRIGDDVFRNVRVEPTPQLEDRVAEAMAEKYWFDVFVRHLAHPLTARLVPADPSRI